MIGILFLGFLIGMAHALEADHLAAVGTMAVEKSQSQKRLALRGAVWGLGHTLTLFVISAAVLLLGFTLTDQFAAGLEMAVGVMLVILGIDVLRKIRAKRVHFHFHHHDGGKPHLHAHSHQGAATPHERDRHEHSHPQGFPFKALLIGLMHGAAGSAGLLALLVAATQEPAFALGYVALFGIGSIIGMALLSFVVAWPLRFAAARAKLVHRTISIGAAGLAIYLGVAIIIETAPLAFAG